MINTLLVDMYIVRVMNPKVYNVVSTITCQAYLMYKFSPLEREPQLGTASFFKTLFISMKNFPEFVVKQS